MVILIAASLPQYGAMSAPIVSHPEKENPLLSPCTIYSDLLTEIPFESDNFEDWPDEYKKKVQEVIEEHFSFLEDAPNCGASDPALLLGPQPKLQQLANSLPTWMSARGHVPPLKQTDIGLVLLEFLNVYECAIQERYYFLTRDAWETVYNKSGESNSMAFSSSSKGATYPLIIEEMFKEMPVLESELLSARDLLNRILTTVSGMNRLVALHKELRCIEGASMDIRNAAALAAETASCLPRIWNAKDPLRDLP